MDLALTPVTEADREFLYEFHRATMREHIERTWGWDEAWQRTDFERRFRAGRTRLITVEGERAGAVATERVPPHVRMIRSHRART